MHRLLIILTLFSTILTAEAKREPQILGYNYFPVIPNPYEFTQDEFKDITDHLLFCTHPRSGTNLTHAIATYLTKTPLYWQKEGPFWRKVALHNQVDLLISEYDTIKTHVLESYPINAGTSLTREKSVSFYKSKVSNNKLTRVDKVMYDRNPDLYTKYLMGYREKEIAPLSVSSKSFHRYKE